MSNRLVILNKIAAVEIKIINPKWGRSNDLVLKNWDA